MNASRRAVLAGLTGLTAAALAGCGSGGSLASGGQTAADPAPGVSGTGLASPAAPVTSAAATPSAAASSPAAGPALSRDAVVARYGQLTPRTWGFGGPGVVRDLGTRRRVIALTFDACGGPGGSEYDAALIAFLRRREVPATLFLNSRWIDENPATFRQLRREPLFELANHGTRHLPLSVTGRSAYGIGGTRNAGEVYDEVAANQVKLTRLLGTPPRFFRAGTAFSDDVADRIVTAMGDQLVTFSVNGDGGATFTPEQVRVTVAAAPAGSIVLCHMNHPRGGTAAGIAAAVPQLQAAGYRFTRLSDGLA
ncbi:MAG: polysaccharide deacetylase family protein [Actinobacteria bacterium]|nr:polysaccharide deacetylase family protein [Actinomycetota bacterium]